MTVVTRTLTSTQTTALNAALRRYRQRGSAYLLPALHDAQAVTGWLDPETCIAISQALNVPLVQVHEVIEFYTLFYNEPVGRRIVRVCDDPPCLLAGSQEVIRACARHLGVDAHHGGTTADGAYTLEIHPCLGHCEQAPFLSIDDEAYGNVQPDQVASLLGGDA